MIIYFNNFADKFNGLSMETTIFYFSATGNSLSFARNLSKRLGDCKIIPVAEVIINNIIDIKADRVGIVFPVYAWGMPRIIEEFVNKLSFNKKTYIFAVATCVAIQGNTLKELDKLLRQRGAGLNAGFAVKAGRSSLMQLNMLDKIIIKLDNNRKQIKSGSDRINEIANTIRKLAFNKPETSSPIANMFGSIFHNLAIKTFKSIDCKFYIEENCNGCGSCVKLCPRLNITLENDRPVFSHNCELCHACIQWCPNFAIKHPDFDISLKQYRNSEIRMNDLLFEKK